ncbi:hypothetical protein CBS147333_9404 [Penicillium roqueforti]|nr:hypothetical protein CBS147333_9404 [Penicillium roqueforti]KAI3198133.1 hypothetical protein CBS147311_6500 [Penicillium roqueforti]KAI3262271.1 hypothetical protein CBS147308_9310 [Penicillium roqueforti]KAI3280650.1 hypothetical protein DTO003C3_9413 [Penicillium roqueforti]
MQDIRMASIVMACFALFPSLTNAFWRLPCRGRTGLARLDPLVDPGTVSSHAHAVHGGGSFGMSSDEASLLESDCTSCAVTQDKSAYWVPALYFMHTNGSAEVVDEVGGMLAYYLLYGENVTAFPSNFRMLAGDPYQRNFTWPVPDPPKSDWSGAQASQAALRQKALGFNCLDYSATAEASLYRHFLPNKTYLDEHCTDGVRFELMFPSCWNGKDVDSTDHKSHVAYPSLVMDGTCPEGFETRLVSLFYETIWNTYAFKDVDGYFALANGDPTGYGYHGDFMQAWDDGILQQAIDTCTSESGIVTDCEIFDVQTEDEQRQCQFPVPSVIKNENCELHEDGLPGDMAIQWGPEYATMKSAATTTTSSVVSVPTISIPTSSLPTVSVGGISIDPNTLLENLHVTSAAEATTSFTSTSTPSPTPTAITSTIIDPITEEIIYLERDVYVICDGNGVVYSTSTGAVRTVSTSLTTIVETSTAVSYAKKDTVPEAVEPVQAAGHARRHLHHRHGHGHNSV